MTCALMLFVGQIMLPNINRNFVLRLFNMGGVARIIFDLMSYAARTQVVGRLKRTRHCQKVALVAIGATALLLIGAVSSVMLRPRLPSGPCSGDIEDVGRGVKDPEQCKRCPFASTCMSDIEVRPAFPPPRTFPAKGRSS